MPNDYISRKAAKNCFVSINNITHLYPFEIINLLYKIPAADVRPVVHGKWEGNEEEIYYYGLSLYK